MAPSASGEADSYAAGRHDELLALIAKSEYRHKSWHDRVWGAKALAASGKPTEAIQYAQDSKGLNAPLTAIAGFCEGVLLDSGSADEAYARYAVAATNAMTNLAIFNAIVKKYSGKPRETILRDLDASRQGNEGKWFAAAKDSGFFELAIELANGSPSDPRTLIRTAKDFAVERPEFALAAGLTAPRSIAKDGATKLPAWSDGCVRGRDGSSRRRGSRCDCGQGGCTGVDCGKSGWGRVYGADIGAPASLIGN